ncbi:MAG: hypothetical protein KGQ59_07515 [Bdellovibrionales bacterium]|nr:hypothetical protein [Bdellovibrionales bacterium]
MRRMYTWILLLAFASSTAWALPQPDQDFLDGVVAVGKESSEVKAAQVLLERMKKRAGFPKSTFLKIENAKWMLPVSKKAYAILELRRSGRLSSEYQTQKELLAELKTLVRQRASKPSKTRVESGITSPENLENIHRFIAYESALADQAAFSATGASIQAGMDALERSGSDVLTCR